MKIFDILEGLEIIEKNFYENFDIDDIVYDSRLIKEGCVFVCLVGASLDGHDFIKDAVNKGAKVIILEKKIELDGFNFVLVKNTRAALAIMSSNFFMHPSKELITIGITGTKGKTTTSCMIKSILECGRGKTGLIGTLGVLVGDRTIETKNTTPESYDLQKYLRSMVDEGCRYAVLEASSIGLREHRLDGFIFDYAVFTNLSQDHIGGFEHKDMQEYAECKSRLFKKCKFGIVNKDDKNLNKIIDGKTCTLKTFGFSQDADIFGSDVELLSENGSLWCKFRVSGEVDFEAKIPIPGKFNVYNALAAICVCKDLGTEIIDIKNGLEVTKVKGRVESVDINKDYTLIIDYAHNAASLENVLLTLKKYNPRRIITMFGAGGNRPKLRRYEMGEISGKYSDLSVITEDNSRFENVMDIIADIKIGIDKTGGSYVVVPNRKEAIEYCMKNAKKGDIVLLAGKGHENYQEIKGEKYYFDEREIVMEIAKTF